MLLTLALLFIKHDVEFWENREKITFKDKGSKVEIGGNVEVLCNPANPSEARVISIWELWGAWSISVVIGINMADLLITLEVVKPSISQKNDREV